MFYSKNTINSLNILIINLCNKDKLNIRYIHITLDVLCEKNLSTFFYYFYSIYQYINKLLFIKSKVSIIQSFNRKERKTIH